MRNVCQRVDVDYHFSILPTFWEGIQNTNMIQYHLHFISVYEYVASKIMYYKMLYEKTGVRANLFSYLAKSINLAPNF